MKQPFTEPFTITIDEFSTPQHDFCVTGVLEQDEPVIQQAYLWDSHNKMKIWLYNDDKDSYNLFNMMG